MVVVIAFVVGMELGSRGAISIGPGDSTSPRTSSAATSSAAVPIDHALPVLLRPSPTREPSLRTVIISTAVSYTLHEWERFVIPLRRVYNGDVAVVVARSEEKIWGELVAKHRITVVALDDKALGKEAFKTQASENAVKKARYAKYNSVCAAYDWCFATDFRDVFFQADPFAMLPLPYDLILSQEWAGYPIKKCHINSEWLLSCWPQSFYNAFKTRPIICSGTILGTPLGFQQLGEAMLAEYANTAKRGPRCLARDQGHLIYLFYSGELEKRMPKRVLVQEAGKGAAMTLALLSPPAIASFVQRRMAHNADGNPAPVAHQFDRWGDLTTMYEWQLLLMKQQDTGGHVFIPDK